MPRRSRGLGAGSQGPLRGISNLVKNLPPGQRDRLNSAFVDAEDLLTFHSLNVPEKQNKRKISGLVKQIEITATSSILGGFVSWERLDDPRISLYEIQVSSDNVFSSADTYQVLDTFFSVEGITTTTFVRVRGVRLDGETGIWSETKQIDPGVSAPQTHSIEFYPLYNLPDSNPHIPNTIVYSGGLNPKGKQEFYTLLSSSFYIDRLNGGLMLWGYVSNRLNKLSETTNVPWDRVRFSVNGIHRLDNYHAHWTNAFSIEGSTINDRTPSGTPVTFYARGGYTSAFGPYAVSVPNTLAGQGPNDANRITTRDASDGTFYWEDKYNARYPSRFDQAQLPEFNSTIAAHEASSYNISPGLSTHWIIFQDFKFNIPADTDIVGIQADIKRRQPNVINDIISVNSGNVRPDKLLGHNAVLEYKRKTVATLNVESGNILEDVNFGRYLDCTAGLGGNNALPSAVSSGWLQGDISGIGDDATFPDPTNNRTRLFSNSSGGFSLATWLKIPTSTVFGGSVLFSATGFTAPNSIQLQCIHATTTPTLITQYRCTITDSLGGLLDLLFTPTATSTLRLRNVFHHLVLTYNPAVGTQGTLSMYVDGILRATATSGGGFNKNFIAPNTLRTFAVAGRPDLVGGNSIAGQAHMALWDGVLGAEEVSELYNRKGFVNYKFNFGSYRSASRLTHYFLNFPDQADIADFKVQLVDSTGIRTDLENKAILTESWPQLGQFFYTDIRQCETIPLAVSDGIPHDNHLAIGYQSYGNELDLWGAPSWSAATVNDFYFGLAIRAKNISSDAFTNNAFIDHARMTIFTVPRTDREIEFSISAAAANAFYLERSVFGTFVNGISVGQLTNESIS